MNGRLKDVITADASASKSFDIDVKYARKIVLQFKRANHTSGTSTLTVAGSVDGGTTFIPLNILRDNATGVLTLVASKVLNSATTALVAVDLFETGFAFTHLRITTANATDGDSTVKAYIEE